MKIRIYLFTTLLLLPLNTFATESTSNPDSCSITQRLKDFVLQNLPYNQVFRTLSDSIQNGSIDFDKLGSQAKKSIADALQSQIDTVTEKITPLPQKISEKAQHNWKEVKATPEKVLNSVSSVGEKAIDLIKPDELINQVNTARNAIETEVSDHTNKFLKTLETAQDKVSGEVDLAKQKAKNLFFHDIAHFVTKEIDSFTSLPRRTQDKVVKLYHESKDHIFDKANEEIEHFIEASKNYAWSGTKWAMSFFKEVMLQVSVLGVLFAVKVILEVRIVIKVKPIQLSVDDMASLFWWKKKKLGILEPAGKGEIEPEKLKKEDFTMKCISIRTEKVSKDPDSFLLKLFLYYEISYFPTVDGEIFLKFIILSDNVAKEDIILKIAAEKFVEESIADECLLTNAINKTVESIDVRVCVDFKSNSGQYLAVHSADFKLALLSDS